MASLALQLRTQCTKCQSPVPVNAVAPAVTCACGALNTITADAWKRVSVAAKMAADAGMAMGASAGERKFQVACAEQAPSCPGCHQPLPMEQAVGYAARGFCHCPACGKKVSLRAVPDALAAVLPVGTSHLVGEDPAQLEGGQAAKVAPFWLFSDL